jgi:hypothetical protein
MGCHATGRVEVGVEGPTPGKAQRRQGLSKFLPKIPTPTYPSLFFILFPCNVSNTLYRSPWKQIHPSKRLLLPFLAT